MPQNYVAEYFKMLGRETAIPGWMGNKNPERVSSISSEPSIKSQKGAGSTKVTTQKIYEGNTDSPATSPRLSRIETANASSSDIEDASESDMKKPSKSPKKGLGEYWAIIATGAGLFSDGYVNNGVGMVVTMIKTIYPKDEYSKSAALQNIASIAFAGTVVGQLSFGLLADHFSRKAGMMISTTILIVFSILCAGSWGVGAPENPGGMLANLTVWRAILGVGIGGEYPAGSVACAETSQKLGAGTRNRWFIWFTNFMIDTGFVTSTFVAWLLLYICDVPKYAKVGNAHGLGTAWRLLMGLGAIPPMILFYLRLKFKENEEFTQNNFKRAPTPWWLIFKRYGLRLCLVSLIWFIYDFCSYSWGIYSSQIISSVVPAGPDGTPNLKITFGWNILFNVFYIPGSFLGGFSSDYFGARLTLAVGTMLQGIVGFILAAQYENLRKHVGPFIVAYGIFMTLGEFGPGDNIGLACSKSSATAIRGRYYGIAAAMGKIGAFVGGYVFPAIANNYGGLENYDAQSVLLYVSSALCVFAAILSLFIPELSQETIALEDIRFRNYLAENGYDPAQMGIEADFEKAVGEAPAPGRV